MRESVGGLKPRGGMKVKTFVRRLTEDVWFLPRKGMTRSHSGGVPSASVRGAHRERTRWDPKDGELCLGRLKPEETLVEGRFDSDVQIDRRTLV